MEQYQRDKILGYLNHLVEKTHDFETLFEGLKAKGMFNDFMISEIMAKPEDGQERLRYLYWYVTTRGPKAFSQLCEVLRRIGNGYLADFLSEKSEYIENCSENGSHSLTLEKEYPDDKEWVVTKAIQRMDVDTNEVYKMSSRIKGLALIINIRNFVNNTAEEREGSEHDIARLKSILTQLDYKVMLYEDLTADEILKKVKAFAAEDAHRRCDSAIVFVMSHNRNDDNTSLTETINILGYDSGTINSQKIIKQLMACNCSALAGKPKIFFFQACRGSSYNYPVLSNVEYNLARDRDATFPHNLQTDGIPQPQTGYNRADSDIIIGYSTSPGFYSLRDPKSGSWYVQTLCRVIAKYAWEKDLGSMLEKVQRECHIENDRRPEDWAIDCRQVERGFNRKLYFQPGFANLDLKRNGS